MVSFEMFSDDLVSIQPFGIHIGYYIRMGMVIKYEISWIFSNRHDGITVFYNHFDGDREKTQNVRVKTIFLLGRDPKKGTKKSKIEKENDIHGDILMARADHTSLSGTIVLFVRSVITSLKLVSTLLKLTLTIRFKTWQSKNTCS